MTYQYRPRGMPARFLQDAPAKVKPARKILHKPEGNN